MKSFVLVGVYVLLVCLPVQPQPNLNDLKHSYVSENSGKIREKRSAIAVLARILRKAREIHHSGKITVYEKAGGFKQAARDFDAFKPTGIQERWDYKRGNIGDSTIYLTKEMGKWRVILKNRKTRPDGGKEVHIEAIEYYY